MMNFLQFENAQQNLSRGLVTQVHKPSWLRSQKPILTLK